MGGQREHGNRRAACEGRNRSSSLSPSPIAFHRWRCKTVALRCHVPVGKARAGAVRGWRNSGLRRGSDTGVAWVAAGCSAEGEEGFDGDVFVEVGPVDADAAADEAEVGALGGGGGMEARKPGEGDGEFAAVGEGDAEGVVRAGDGDGDRVRLECGDVGAGVAQSRLAFRA